MKSKLTAKEAENRLAGLPTRRAYLIGTVMGIALSLVAQLLLKPISIGSDTYGNYTIRSGDRVVSTVPPTTYFVLAILGLGVAIVAWWFLQRWLAGVTGWTNDKVHHGVGEAGLSSFVSQLTSSLEKLKIHGFETHSHPGDPGTFELALVSTYDEDDNVRLKVEPFVALVEARAGDRLSLEGARMAIACIRELEVNKTTDTGHHQSARP
jgi:hypothetical protein